MMSYDEVLSRLDVKSRSNGTAQAICPAHDDREPSLSVSVADHGGTVLYCHAGCPPDAILDAVGLSWADVQPDDPDWTPTRPLTRRTAARPRLSETQHEPTTFWTPDRLKALRAAQERLRAEPGHPLAEMAAERDGITLDTLTRYGCGIMTDDEVKGLNPKWPLMGRAWLTFPYPTGAQLYRREGDGKDLYSLRGSTPKGAFFGITKLEGHAALIVTKSPRETMLLAAFEGIGVIGLPGGEKAELSPEQEAIIREIAPRYESIRVVMDCDTDKARGVASSFARAVAAAADPVPVGMVDVTAATGGEHKDLTDVWRAEGIEAVAEALAHGEIVAPREDEPADADDAPEPEPIRWKPMPLEVLPDAVADYATAHGAAINCDPAFIAVPALAVLATAIGTRYRVRLKRSWDEPATLWISTVAPSGSAKSPALDAALRPVRALEREAAQHYREEMLLYREDHKAWKALPKDERGETPEPEPPKRHRRIISDATVEAVMDRHADAPGGLLLARDEVSGWMDGMNRYANAGGEMQSWIELREGRPVTVDRKTGDTKVYFIGRPAVSVVGTTQPSVVSKSLTAAHFASGFAARLTLVMPPTAARRWTDADVSLEVFDAYDALVRRLDEMPVPAEDDDVPTVELSPDARRTFAAFVDENGDLMDSLPDGPLRSAYAKIEALAARFALIFHLSDHVTGPGRIAEPQPINGHTMERAVYLARWIRHETARIYDVLGFNEAAKSDDEKLVDKLPEVFGWEDVADAAKVQERGAFKIIDRLKSAGLVERVSRGKYRPAPEGRRQYGQYGQ